MNFHTEIFAYNDGTSNGDFLHVNRGLHTAEILTKIKKSSAFRADFSLITNLSSMEIILREQAEGSISASTALGELQVVLTEESVVNFFNTVLPELGNSSIFDALRAAISEDVETTKSENREATKFFSQAMLQYE